MLVVRDDLIFYQNKNWTPSENPNMRCFVATEALGISSMIQSYLGFLAPTPQLADAMSRLKYSSAEWQRCNSESMFPLTVPTGMLEQEWDLDEEEVNRLAALMAQLETCKCLVKLMLVRLHPNMDEHLKDQCIHFHHENPPYYGGTLGSSEKLDNPSDISVIFTCPADERTVSKARFSRKLFITETADTYTKMVPFINKQANNLQWVYNILEFKKEVQDLLYVDTDALNGFVLCPDTKWSTRTEAQESAVVVNNYAVNGAIQGSLVVNDQLQVSCDNQVCDEAIISRKTILAKYLLNFYLLAICNLHGVMSLRDLTTSHLPLLKNMRDSIRQFLLHTFNLRPEEVSLHFHYPPSFYHQHLHVTVLDNTSMIEPFRCVLLDDVIEHIEKNNNMMNHTFRFYLHDNMPVTQEYIKYQ